MNALRRGILALRGSAIVPLRRARRDVVALLGLAVLVALTSASAVIADRTVNAAVDAAAREAVVDAGRGPDLVLRTAVGHSTSFEPTVSAVDLLGAVDDVQSALPPSLREVSGRISVGIVSPQVQGMREGEQLHVQLAVIDPTASVDVAAGALDDATEEQIEERGAPIAISRATARATGLAVGDVIETGDDVSAASLALRVSAVIDADPSSPAWADAPGIWDPSPLSSAGAAVGWSFTVTTTATTLDAIAERLPGSSDGAIRIPLDPAKISAARLAAATAAIDDALRHSAEFTGSIPIDLSTTSRIDQSLADLPARVSAGRGQLLMLEVGLVGGALTIVLAVSGLLAARRSADVRLLRARGASVSLIALHASAESFAVSLLGLLVGITVTGGWGAVPIAAIVAALITAVVPVVHTVSAANRMSDRARGVTRAAATAALLAVTATAVVALRLRADATPGDVDLLAVAAPLLVAISVSVAVGAIVSLVLRRSASAGARARGAGLLVATGRGTSVDAAGLVALTLAVTLATSGGVLVGTLEHAQQIASWRTVGADARIEGDLSATAIADLTARADLATVLDLIPDAETQGPAASRTITLLAVDARLAASLEALPVDAPGHADAAAVRALLVASQRAGADAALPVLLDESLHSDTAGGGPEAQLRIHGETLATTVLPSMLLAAIGDHTRTLALVSREALAARLEVTPRSSTVLLTGVHGRVPAIPGAEIVLRSDVLADAESRAFPAAITDASGAVVVGSAALGVLALALAAAAGRPGRRRSLALLRALGAPARLGIGLTLGDLVPLSLAGIGGGALASIAIAIVVGPAFGVGSLVGIDVGATVDPVRVLVLWGGTALATAVVATIDVPLVRRASVTGILREGEAS